MNESLKHLHELHEAVAAVREVEKTLATLKTNQQILQLGTKIDLLQEVFDLSSFTTVRLPDGEESIQRTTIYSAEKQKLLDRAQEITRRAATFYQSITGILTESQFSEAASIMADIDVVVRENKAVEAAYKGETSH